MTPADAGRPPSEDVLANLTRLTELRLQVQEDATLGVVTIDVQGLQDGCSVIVAPPAALDLALRLTGACARLRKVELEKPPPGSAGPFSARF